MVNLIQPNITDILGNAPTQSSIFIIITGDDIHNLLTKIAQEGTTRIYKYNRSEIDKILEYRGLDPADYVSLGHVMLSSDEHISQLILAKKDYCKIPSDPNNCKLIAQFDNGAIYEPQWNDKKYVAIGLFFNRDTDSVRHYYEACMIPRDVTFLFKRGDIKSNEFNLLSHKNSEVRSVSRAKLKENADNIKIMSSDGKYITRVDVGNKSVPEITDKLHENYQLFTYNTQGELIVDGKCLTFNDTSKTSLDSELFFGDCSSSDSKDNQKWFMYKGKIIPQADYQKCITQNSSNVSLSKCEQSDSQIWDTENNNSNSTSDYKWDHYKGKTVVLVEKDDPWYINKDFTIPMKLRSHVNIIGDINQLRDNADFLSTSVLDGDKPNLGLGYSYADRQGVNCQKIEHFNKTNGNNDAHILILICIIVCLLIWYRCYKYTC